MAQTRLKSGNLHMVGGDNGTSGNVLKSKGDGTMEWGAAVTPPTFSSVDYPGDDTALDPAGGQSLVINGGNFVSGITVTIGGTSASSVTLNSAIQITVTTPAKTAGTYDIVFTNTDGGTATASNAVSYNGVPAFTNAAGSLGSVEEGSTVNLSAAATEPDGGAITYAITSGSLPSGLSLNSSTGAITGTAPSVSADTTSNFTVTATDNENQTASRAYSITVTNILPSDNFNVVTYTGNGSARSITGVGFKPDFVWIKDRSAGNWHYLFDSTRGGNKPIFSNATGAESVNDNNGYLSSFDADGFSITPGSLGMVSLNASGNTYVAWCWKANEGATSSNTDGSITSTVQTNNNLGFSIVKYAGNGSSSATVGHNLGAIPDLTIFKQLDSGGTSGGLWNTYLTSNNTVGFLNTNGAFVSNTGGTNGTVDIANMSSTTFGFLNGSSSVNNQNNNGTNYIVYCFKSITGFSKIGSYTGNGSTNGPIVETGFEPAFVIIKRTDTADNWSMTDNKRSTSNPRDNALFPNLTQSELTSGYSVNYLSNGFQIATSGAGVNASGGTFLYIAFAADPDTTSPTLADSFSTVTYTGNGGTQSITGLGFKPNMVWIKNRSTTASHLLHDSVRGTGSTKTLFPNNTPAQGSLTSYGWIDSFDTNGFTVNASTNGHHSNRNGDSYVAWAWKADDNEPAINTNGSINSIVSTNANAGFSIVSYTGNGVQGATVAHGLGSAPDMIIIKDLSSTEVWLVGNSESGWTKAMHLNLTNADNASNLYWDDTAPTSTVFSIGAFGTSYNVSGNHYIAYCFKSTSGFSKIGSYTGNGGSNSITGLGFQPDFVMIKSLGSGSWFLYDSQRTVSVGDNAGTANARPYILANTDGKENGATSTNVNLDSNGFSMNTSAGDLNTNGTTYIYMAFKIN